MIHKYWNVRLRSPGDDVLDGMKIEGEATED